VSPAGPANGCAVYSDLSRFYELRLAEFTEPDSDARSDNDPILPASFVRQSFRTAKHLVIIAGRCKQTQIDACL